MVYFAYGALGIIDVTRDVWVKEALTLSPAEIAAIGVWLTLALDDQGRVRRTRRQRADLRLAAAVYILLGALFTASGMVTLASAAGQWFPGSGLARMYVLGMSLIVIGTVIQDVVADAMSTEVVERVDADGEPRADEEVRAELGMVQVLGRLALSIGILAVAGMSGYLAKIFRATRCS
jgi:cytochrome c biogenesis protein CcdA